MMTTEFLVNAAKSKLGVTSDYAIAPHLGLYKQTVSVYRTRGITMSDVTCIKLAEILDCDPAILYAAMQAERAKNPSAREVWIKIWRTLGGENLQAELELMMKQKGKKKGAITPFRDLFDLAQLPAPH